MSKQPTQRPWNPKAPLPGVQGSDFKYHDSFRHARTEVAGKQRLGYFYGTFEDRTLVLGTPKKKPASDLLQLNTLSFDIKPLHIPQNYFRQSNRHRLGNFDRIFNLIVNPEKDAKILEIASKMAAEFEGTILNHPDAILESTRDVVWNRLKDLPGFKMPRTLRLTNMRPGALAKLQEGGLVTFPAIVRNAGTHLGTSMRIVDSWEKLLAILPPRYDLYVTPLVPTRSRDGFFRKARFFFIGNSIIPLHLYVSDHWNVHGKDRERFMKTRPQLLEQERRFVERGFDGLSSVLKDSLIEVRKRMKLDFFGLDCAFINPETVVVFECNAAMNAYNKAMEDPHYAYLHPVLEQARAGFRTLLNPGYKSAYSAE